MKGKRFSLHAPLSRLWAVTTGEIQFRRFQADATGTGLSGSGFCNPWLAPWRPTAERPISQERSNRHARH